MVIGSLFDEHEPVNVTAGTKVPRIGNAPTYFIASCLTLHEPETHRRDWKRTRAAIHRRFRVRGDAASRDSVEHRARCSPASTGTLRGERGDRFRKRESDLGCRTIVTIRARRVARLAEHRDRSSTASGRVPAARSAIDTPLNRPHDTTRGSVGRAVFRRRTCTELPHDGCHRSAICRRRQCMAYRSRRACAALRCHDEH